MNKFLKSVGICSTDEGGFGVPDSNVILCTSCFGPNGKGEALAHLPITEFIDDTLDCLWSVSSDPQGNCMQTLQGLFHFDMESKWKDYSDEWVRPGCSLIKISDWREMTDWFCLDTTWLWDWLCANGPPFKAFGPDFWTRFADAESAMAIKATSKYLQSNTSGNYKKWSQALKQLAAGAASSSSGKDTSSHDDQSSKTDSAAAPKKACAAASAADAPEEDEESTVIIADEGTESPSERVVIVQDHDTMTETFTDPGPCLGQDVINCMLSYFGGCASLAILNVFILASKGLLGLLDSMVPLRYRRLS